MSLLALGFLAFIATHRGIVVGLPLVATAHAVAMALTFGLLSFLFFTQARGEAQLGYLILGFTFGFSGLIWAWYPYFFPNGLAYAVPEAPVAGNDNSAGVLYMVIRWAMLIGITIAAVAISRASILDIARMPRVSVAVTAMAVLSAVVLAWAALGVPGMSPMTYMDQLSTMTVALVVIATLCCSAFSLLVLVRLSRSGSLVSRWLLTVALLQFLEACAIPFSPRLSANWHAIRWLSLISSLMLLFTLLWQITRIQRATAKAADLDELTGALSRSAFVRVVSEHLAAAPQVRAGSGILWIDLDQFRLLNAAAGSDGGDAFLRECFDRLQGFVPSADLVSRIGGDEFAVLMRAQSPADLLERGMQVAESMSRPFDVPDGRVTSTASIGCAWIDETVDSAEEALRRAFAAMQAAKETGGDTSQLFSPELDEQAASQLQWRHRLAVAIRDEAFENAYQPIFNASTGAVVAVEALIRLRDGERLINAGEFISYAEASGQIVAIGRLGVQRLTRDLPRLLESDPMAQVSVSLNLSVLQLADPVVIGMLLKPPLHTSAKRLIVEVTESVEFSASTLAHENLMRLVRAGYRIAIDDFGAGFSNFVQLEEIGRHIIKLDRSLIVRAGTREPSSLSVLAAALAVAKSLASEVLAEGVETAEEAAIVREVGIELVQGFRFARPMPLEAVVAFVAATNAGIVQDVHP